MCPLLAGLLMATPVVSARRELVLFDADSGVFGDDGAALVMLLTKVL